MEQYHYISLFKAPFIFAGMVTQYIGYVYKTSIGEFEIAFSRGSIGILVMVQVYKRYHD